MFAFPDHLICHLMTNLHVITISHEEEYNTHYYVIVIVVNAFLRGCFLSTFKIIIASLKDLIVQSTGINKIARNKPPYTKRFICDERELTTIKIL